MIKKNIPNLLTCANLFCGCVGIVFALGGDLLWTGYMVGIACIFDFLDGFVARLLNVHSEIGKQLDSLADMVTFGVVPGMVMFMLMTRSYTSDGTIVAVQVSGFLSYWVLLGFLITIFSALRLAKFNIDTRQSESFIGLPTPANSILICSLPLMMYQHKWSLLFGGEDMYTFVDVNTFLMNPYFLVSLTIVLSLLLVAELPLFALKFKNFTWVDNKIRFVFLGMSLSLLIIFQYVGIPFIIVLYIVLSVINNLIRKSANSES